MRIALFFTTQWKEQSLLCDTRIQFFEGGGGGATDVSVVTSGEVKWKNYI